MSDGLRAETVTISGHGGDEVEAYLAQPLAEQPHGSVVVIHHMPGYDEFFKEVSAAAAGSSQPNPAVLLPIFKKYDLEVLGPPLAARQLAVEAMA